MAIQVSMIRLAQQLGQPELAEPFRRDAFQAATKSCVEGMLVKLGDQKPELAQEVYQILKGSASAPDDPDSLFSS